MNKKITIEELSAREYMSLLGKRSAEARKRKMGQAAFANHLRIIASKPRKVKMYSRVERP